MRGKNLLDFSLCQQVWESSGISWGDMNMFLILFCWVTDPRMSLTTSGQSFFQQPFIVTDSAHPWPPLYYYAIWFPAFTDTKRGLLLARIHDAAECAVRVIMDEYHDRYLAEWLQWWGGFPGDTLYGYFDGQEQNPADSRTMRPYNASFLTSGTTQPHEQSNCWTNPAITASSTKPPYLTSITIANDLFFNN